MLPTFQPSPFRTRLIAGHTGWMAVYPQNTILSIGKAIEVRSNLIEIDLRLTSDNVWVLYHQLELSDLTDGVGLIHTKDWSYVQTLDAGYVYQDGRYAGQEDTKIPSLEEALNLIKDKPVKFELDLKQWSWNPYLILEEELSQMTSLVNLIKSHDMLDRCIFLSTEDICNKLIDNFLNIETAVYYYGDDYRNSDYNSALQNAITKGHKEIHWMEGVYDDYPNTYVTKEMVKAFQDEGILFGVTTIPNHFPGTAYRCRVYDAIGVNVYVVDHLTGAIDALRLTPRFFDPSFA